MRVPPPDPCRRRRPSRLAVATKTETGAACPGTSLPKFGVDAVKKAVFEQANPTGATVGGTYNKCSSGRTTLTPANSLVAEVVELPCNGTNNDVAWSTQTCNFDDFNGWADAADAALVARGVDLSQYKYRVYLLPPNTQCGWVGLGYVGCDGSFECRTWIGGDFWASPMAISHELGHNIYMAHATTNRDGKFDEYGDSTCFMGHCCNDRCPNTAHMWQLGWVSLQQLDSTTLKAGETVTATIAAQPTLTKTTAATRSAGVRINAGWAAGVQPIYVGFRTKAAGSGDSSLDSDLVGRVHVYMSAITNSYDPQTTDWKAGLAVGGAWTQATAGVVVRVKAVTSTAATVTICRKGGAKTLASCQAGLDNDCNGLVGNKDTACVPLLKKAAAAKKSA